MADYGTLTMQYNTGTDASTQTELRFTRRVASCTR
jgi:hypothetical protein